MSIAIADRQDKSAAVDILQRVCQHFIFRGIPQTQREAILIYLTWMRNHKDTLNVQCSFQTIPELQLSRLVVETTFGATKETFDARANRRTN